MHLRYRKDIIIWLIVTVYTTILYFWFIDFLALSVAIALIIYFLLQYVEEKKKGDKNILKIIIFIFLFLTVTLVTAIDKLQPIIIKMETIYDRNIPNFNKGEENIYFNTKLKIIEPINLKIKDTYTNLAYKTDYNCIDNFVFINYKFGNRNEINEKIAKLGLVFTYKAKVFLMSEEYKNYRKQINDFKKLRKSKTK
jgi:hypothetical protein